MKQNSVFSYEKTKLSKGTAEAAPKEEQHEFAPQNT